MQVTDKMVEVAAEQIYPTWQSMSETSQRIVRLDMRRALTAALAHRETEAVADIVPEYCTSSVLVFSEGVLCVNKDGSGHIVVDENDFDLEDDRREGPDGPQGSIHWITRFPPGEMQALKDFLNGVPFATNRSALVAPPAQEAVADEIAENELQEIADGAWGDNPAIRGAARERLAALAEPTGEVEPEPLRQWREDQLDRVKDGSFLSASPPAPAVPSGMVKETSVMVCPQCEGEGSYADGLDEAACTTTCARCEGNGWIVDLATIDALTAAQEGR